MFLSYRPFGTYGWLFWLLIVTNLAIPQVLWVRRMRRSPVALLAVGVSVLIGMWLERFVIVITSLAHDYVPSSWHSYTPTAVDWGILLGSFALFGFLFLLFLRFIPFVPISELKKLQHQLEEAS
jgi:molybdopterin-containing oxidoreductase family membrane subunit